MKVLLRMGASLNSVFRFAEKGTFVVTPMRFERTIAHESVIAHGCIPELSFPLRGKGYFRSKELKIQAVGLSHGLLCDIRALRSLYHKSFRQDAHRILQAESEKDMDKNMETETVTVRNTVLGDGTPKICVPITAANWRELEEQVQKVLTVPCDMVEWRADFFEEADDGKWLTQAMQFLRGALGELPLLFTFRTKEEGGERSVSLEEYERLNVSAASTGLADLVDVELNRGEQLLCSLAERLHGYGALVIGSFHDFSGTPKKQEITDILCRIQSCGADISKAAVMPRSEADVMTLLEASLEMKMRYADRPYITMSMGSLGAVSRLAGSLTGSAVTFATAGRASAPGQMEAQALALLLPALEVE